MELREKALTSSRGARNSTAEFWRFAFTVLVCLYHFEMYFFSRTKLLPSGSSAVEFFFVLAGFLMAKSAKRDLAGRSEPVSVREAHSKAVEFVKKKLQAILPVVVMALILGLLVYPAFPAPLADRLKNLQNTEWELLLMVGTPFGYNNGAAPIVPMWFLTALIVVGYVYTFAIYRYHDFVMFAAPVIGVLFYVFFTLNSSLLLDFFVKMGFLNAGMVRAVAEMSFGVSMFLLYEYLSKKKLGRLWRILLSLLEIYAVYRLFALMFWQPLGMDNFRRIVYIMAVVLLSFLNVTALSRALDRKIWNRLASISLPMYLCHFHLISLYFQLITLWKMRLFQLSATSPAARTMLGFLQDTGGVDSSFRPAPMTLKDMILFMLLVIAVSTLVTLYISFVRKYCVKPLVELMRERRAEKSRKAGMAAG